MKVMIHSFKAYFRLKEIFFFVNRRETSGMFTTLKSKKDMHMQLEKKMKFYMKVYEDLFGITKLTEMQDKVRDIQAEIQNVQEKRRTMQEEIFIVQKKLEEMQDILRKISMGDDMYISVVTQVHELLKEQRRLKDVFSLYDQTEREQQTTLAMAIKNSQDQERTYREKNKYFSLITGITGAILGLVGSSLNNWRHRKDIKNFASDISNEVIFISDQVSELKKSVQTINLVTTSSGKEVSNASSEADNDLFSSKTDNQNINEHIEELMNGLEKSIELKLKNLTYKNIGLSVTVLGSCSLLFSLIVFYMTRN